MALDTATSVSKGCFSFKGKNKKANAEDYIDCVGDRFAISRLKLYRDLWYSLQWQIDILRSDLNTKISDDLIAFISSCHKERDNHRLIGEIPTAALIMGVNTPDHDIMLSNIYSMIKAKVTPLVARIMSKDCCRVAKLISSIVLQFMGIFASTNYDDDEEKELAMEYTDESENKTDFETSPLQLKSTVTHKRGVTMSTLVKWYNKHFTSEKKPSPWKKARVSHSHGKSKTPQKIAHESNLKEECEVIQSPLIVVMLEDIENINPDVLQDFLSLCSSYLSSLPIVLVFGIATSLTTVHQLLPTSVSSLLCMEKFQTPPASHYLTHLMDRVIMTPDFPFKLGPKVFHFLLDKFLYHDFSILNYVMGLHVSAIEHYLSNPLSLMCCSPTKIDDIASSLTHTQLEEIRRQPAFMRHVEEISSSLQAKLLTDDPATKKHLSEEVKAIHLFHAKMFPALRFLHGLGLHLPKHPLGKQFRELYSVVLTKNVCQSDGYKEAFSLLRMMSINDLCESLNLSLKTLTDTKDELEEIGKLHQVVEKFIDQLQHIEEESEEDNHKGSGDVSQILPQRTKLHELKETLQSMSSRRRRSPYEQLREDILDTLDSTFQTLLVCPMSNPLHEIFYFNDVAAIQYHIQAAPRCSIQHALTQPGKYLNCPCCQCEADSILPTMPDVCIAYKLHLECGTLVNLYDWLQAFVTVIESKDQNATKKEKKKKPTVELRARFIRAVSELQFLGFIKATRRKTDHVTRLTW